MKDYTISDFKKKKCVFWSMGNNPTQLTNGISNDELSLHLKSLYLLSDYIFGAASFFYESHITREVSGELKPLFTSGKIIYFIDENIEDFAEHGEKKVEKSPPGLDCYSDKEITARFSLQLSALGHTLRRQSGSISDKIVELWIEDLFLAHPFSMGGKLSEYLKNNEKCANTKRQLIEIATTRSTHDFVWDYLKPRLEKLEFPPWLLRFSRIRLSQMYAAATASILNVPLDNHISILSDHVISKKSIYDTSLFVGCMDSIGVLDSLKKISAHDLMTLKKSPEFIFFYEFYCSLIYSLQYDQNEINLWLPKYLHAENRILSGGISATEFVSKFKKLCCILKKDSGIYSKPLDILISTYVCFGIAPITKFTSLLSKFSNLQVNKDELSGADMSKTSTHETEQIDIVIVTALEKELNAVLRHIGNTEKIVTTHRTYFKSKIQHQDQLVAYNVVIVSLPGMGNVQAGIATTQAIAVWNPSKIILVGITAGIKEESVSWDSRWLGDLLIAENIVGYELAKVKNGQTNRRYQEIRPAFELISRAKEMDERWVSGISIPRPDGSSGRIIPKVHFGLVASGEKVIADEQFAGELKSDWSEIAGIEMESYGTALASFQSDTAPGMLMVKGICDWADNEKNDDWQEYAADIAATFTIELLKTRPFESTAKTQAKRKIEFIEKEFSGKDKLLLCQRIGSDWKDLADYFDIPIYKQDQFAKGEEMREIWHWLERRKKLDELSDALKFINRPDLAEIPGSHR